MSNTTAQIHFKVLQSQKDAIEKWARIKGISVSEFYRESAAKQIKRDQFLKKSNDFDKKLQNDAPRPMLHSRKAFIKWMNQ